MDYGFGKSAMPIRNKGKEEIEQVNQESVKMVEERENSQGDFEVDTIN